MSDTWRPEDELARPTTSAESLDLYEDGWKWCFPHQGWWNPRTWQECPVCFEANKPRNLSDDGLPAPGEIEEIRNEVYDSESPGG